MIQIQHRAIADGIADQIAQLRIAQPQPAPLGDAVRFVAEAIRIDRVPFAEYIVLQNLRMDRRHAVYMARSVHRQIRHVYAPVPDDAHRVRAFDRVLFQHPRKLRIDFADHAHHVRRDLAQKIDIPAFQRFAHHGVVRVAERALRDRERIRERHARLRQQPNQLRNRHRGVRIVQLYRVLIGEMRIIIAEVFAIGAQHILKRSAAQHVLLANAHQLACAQGIVRVQQLCDVLGGVFIARSRRVILRVEQIEIKRVIAFALPQAQRAEIAPAIADHRHIVGHGANGEPLHGHGYGKRVPTNAPRIAVLRPIIRQFNLMAVDKFLMEQPVPVAQAVAVQRNVVRGGAVQKACRQPAQTAVAQRGVLDILKIGKGCAARAERIAQGFQNAQRIQIAVDHPPHQIFGGQIDRPPMRAALRMIIRPHRCDGDHHRIGYALVQLYRAGGGQSHMVFAFDDFAGAIRDFIYINLGRAAAIVPAIQYADAARDGRIIGIRHAPRPVSAHRAGQIHARGTIQHQKILHRRDGGIADAAPGAFQHRGNDIIIPGMHVQGAARERAVFFIAIRPPAQRGIVIVRSGVDHGIFRMLRGQVGVVFIAVEGELKHLHAGIAARLQQTAHLAADHAQILRHDAKLRHCALHALKQLPPRPLFIFPAQRVFRARGHGEIIRKADEMIHAQNIEHARLRAEAADPPCVAGLFMHVPAVERIAPELTRGLECIRRHARDANRAQIIVQFKKLRIQPYIAGFIRYVNRHIAHQRDVLCL